MSKPAFKDCLKLLSKHKTRLAGTHMRDLFGQDPARFEKFSLCLDTLVFDYSKNRIDADVMAALVETANALGVAKKRDAMFAGKIVNPTENRAALHMALRGGTEQTLVVDGKNVTHEVNAVLSQMRVFADAIRDGGYKVTGGRVRDVVNIGIGGSDLGPAMATRALGTFCDGPALHFVSNVDSADLLETLSGLNPETTLFIIASKTFTTTETMLNAATAREWLAAKIGTEQAASHFVAISSNLEATSRFGIPEERCFAIWDWVGGRYSVWSAIGLSLMLAIGPQDFDDFLAGATLVDDHFKTAPLAQNIPVIMALLGVWYRNCWDCPAHAVLPYDNRLAGLPAWLQQLDMESNGKTVDLDGHGIAYPTGPIVFGEPGTNGQHAFFQALHQGSEIVPCDFLVAAGSAEDRDGHRLILAANCFAQSEALMRGKTLAEAEAELLAGGMSKKKISRLAPHKVFEGNRPSNTFVYERLNPRTLGMLLALYEHKTFVQGALWNINPFDQWGVELGKQLAGDILPMLENADPSKSNNSSTQGLLRAFSKFRED